MSGGLPPKPGGPAGAGGGDPAMDDILASIRRILNEDEPPPSPAELRGAPPPEPLELTEAMMVASPEPVAPRVSVAISPEPEPEPEPVTPPPLAPPLAAPVMMAPMMMPSAGPLPAPTPSPMPAELPAEGLVAPAVAAATTAALSQLLRSVAAERQAPVSRGGPSIEDLVREELRPLLKAWLDQHLPPLVERAVRVEIERVVGRALP